MPIPWNNPSSLTSPSVNAGDDALAADFNALRVDALAAFNPPPAFWNMYYALSGSALDYRTTGFSSNDNRPMYTDDRNVLPWAELLTASPKNLHAWNAASGGDSQQRDVSNEMATADEIHGVVKIGAYIYALLWDVGVPSAELWRYDLDDLTSASQMTMSGKALNANANGFVLFSDGTNLYFNQETGAGSSIQYHKFDKFTISGTTATYDSQITCAATAANLAKGACVDGDGNFYGMDASGTIRRYNSSGTLQATISDDETILKLGPVIEGIPFLTRTDTTNFFTSFIRCPLLP